MDNLSGFSVSSGKGLIHQLDSIENLLDCDHVDQLREGKIGLLLLSTLRECLRVSPNQEYDVRVADRILHLFTRISGTETSTEDLRILVSLFHLPSAPIHLLTSTLCQVTCCKPSGSNAVHKECFIQFPRAPIIPSAVDVSEREFGLRSEHKRLSVGTGWSHSAMCIPINDVKKTSAITFSSWIFLKEPICDETDDTNSVHLISLAYEDLCFGVWIDFKRGKLKYKISKSNDVIFEATETSFCDEFIFEELTHVAIIWELTSGSLKVKVNVNGEFINRSCTSFPANIFVIELIQYLLIGSSQETNLCYTLYPLKFFLKSLSWEEIAALFFLGPSCDMSVPFSGLELPSMNINLGVKIVEEFIQSPAIFQNAMTSIVESLYFEYPNKSRSIHCDTTILFPPNHKNPRDVKFTHVIPFSDCKWSSSGQVINAISDIGGINFVIFLLARTFELSSDQSTQSNALQFALRISACHHSFENSFYSNDGYLMINQVICSDKCSPSEDLFYSYFNHTIVNTAGGVLIRSSKAFNGLFLCWRTWIRIPCQSGLLFTVVSNLLDDPVWFEMNLIQMRRADVLQEILLMLQISFLQREDGHLELLKDIDFKNLAKILQILIGTSPVHLPSFESFVKSLVLIHNSNLAYVGLSSKLFYFSIPPNKTRFRESISPITRTSSSNSSSDEWQVIRRSADGEVMPDAVHNRILKELLSILCTIIYDLDDVSSKNILLSLLKIEHIMIWINNTSEDVRSTVLKILFVALRKSPMFTQSFLENKSFNLLAIQLAQYHPSMDTHALLVNFILGRRPFDPFVDGDVSDHNWTHLKAIEAACFVPFLSFQVYTSNNSHLSQYSLKVLCEIIDALPLSSPALKSLHDHSIGECLVNILLNDPEKQVMDALRTVIAVLSKKYMHSTGRIFFEVYFEMIDLFLNLSVQSNGDFSGRCWECVITMLKEGLESFRCHEDIFIDSNLSASTRQSSFDWMSIGVRVRSLSTSTRETRLDYSEIVERLHHFVSRSVEILMLKDSCVSDDHKEFVRTIFESICFFAAKISSRRSLTTFFSLQKFLKSKSTQLFTFMMSPSIDPEEKVEFLLWVVKRIEYDVDKWLNKNRGDFVSKLIDPCLDNMDDSTSDAIFRMFKNVTKSRMNVSEKELNDWSLDLQNIRSSAIEGVKKRFEVKMMKMQRFKDDLIYNANKVTNIFVGDQNVERSKYIDHLKKASREKYSLQIRFRDIVKLMTHEKAVFFDEKSFPKSWQLDQTEGPSRIRRKLKRHHLDVHEKFLSPEFTSHCVNTKVQEPLSYLVDQSICEIVVDYISTSESSADHNVCKQQDICYLITPQTEYQGELLVSSTCIYFIGKNTSGQENGIITKVWKIDEVDEVEPRRYQLVDNAVELFMVDGTTHMLSFDSEQARNDVCQRIGARSCLDLATVTQLWKERQVTTFDYLMYLNKMAGRSFNDLMIYPVFPFVLSDYKSDTIDLKNPETFRDLKKPMAIQKKSREVYYKEQYDYLKKVAEQDITGNPVSFPVYHYGSHYSNSGTVLHFLVRLPPFTQMFLQYQDNNFDIPDRTFHSMHVAWDLASGGSTTDFKELIPEFFFLPEFLINLQGFKFGSRLNGQPVNDVFLPNWCRKDSRLFVLINRQALESDYVSSRICHWIDLIFGYKQSGKAAVEAVNVFHPATYFGVTSSDIEDSLEIDALRTMIRTYGQMPKQLFTGPHPTRTPGKKQKKEVCPVTGEVPSLIWGDYLGSPTAPDPIITFRKNLRKQFLMKATLTNDVFGSSPKSCLIISYSNNKMRPLVNVSYIDKLSLLDWDNPRCHLYLINNCQDMKKREIKPVHGIDYELDGVTVCESLSSSGLVFVGLQSGRIAVFSLSKTFVEIKLHSWLLGHTGSIKTIVASPEFRVVISGSEDGSCLMWDCNTLAYVRTFCSVGTPIELICVSPTLGDVAIVFKYTDHECGSRVLVQTINGQTVSDFRTKVEITAICYSGAQEGISVNLLVAGFIDGSIQMWSSWDLTPVRKLIDGKYSRPISSICYSFDSEHLHVADESGALVVWTKSGHHSKHPTFTIL